MESATDWILTKDPGPPPCLRSSRSTLVWLYTFSKAALDDFPSDSARACQ